MKAVGLDTSSSILLHVSSKADLLHNPNHAAMVYFMCW